MENVVNEVTKSTLVVPASALSPETLSAVIESFILREGTDYGAVEISLADKMEKVRDQLDKKEIILVYDVESETLTFLSSEQLTPQQKKDLSHV